MDKIKKNFGFGMMRLPMNGEEVNIEETKEMVDAFLNAGYYYNDVHTSEGRKASDCIKCANVKRLARSISRFVSFWPMLQKHLKRIRKNKTAPQILIPPLLRKTPFYRRSFSHRMGFYLSDCRSGFFRKAL